MTGQARYVVSFRTTADAMAMEALCSRLGLPGRLIPTPRVISAGCGLCWSAPLTHRTAVEDLVMAQHLAVDGLYELVL